MPENTASDASRLFVDPDDGVILLRFRVAVSTGSEHLIVHAQRTQRIPCWRQPELLLEETELKSCENHGNRMTLSLSISWTVIQRVWSGFFVFPRVKRIVQWNWGTMLLTLFWDVCLLPHAIQWRLPWKETDTSSLSLAARVTVELAAEHIPRTSWRWMSLLTLLTIESVSQYNEFQSNNLWSDLPRIRSRWLSLLPCWPVSSCRSTLSFQPKSVWSDLLHVYV